MTEVNSTTFLARLSDHLFWDTDRSLVDAVCHGDFLITRVMDRGTMADVEATWAHYGPDRIRDALVKAAVLDKKTIAFFANQFHLPREAFRAYRTPGSNWTS